MTDLYQAHQQWLVRPPDERFATLPLLYDFVKERQQRSSEDVRHLSHVKVEVAPDGTILINGDSPPASLTNWSFNQLSTIVQAPSRYLRTLPPDMVRDCLSFGLQRCKAESKLMFREVPFQNGSFSQPQAAAFTGPTYGRIWDADVMESLMSAIEGSSWHVPPAHSNYGSDNAGLYASDRDLFAFLVNDENPVEIGNAKLGRGFFVWNSETGAATFGLTTFLFNYVCGNHIVWGAEDVNELRIVHRDRAPDRYYQQALPVLNRFVESRSVSDSVTTAIDRAMQHKIGASIEDVLKWFAPKPFTRREVTDAYAIGQAEGDDPTTVWGIVQGLTAHARNIRHIDQRVDLERRAGALLI